MLVNGDFEGGWREVQGIGELKVANGWMPWWDNRDTRPEYKIATRDVDSWRIFSGNQAQQWFTSLATHTAGIYQRVEGLTVGAPLTLTMHDAGLSTVIGWHDRDSSGRKLSPEQALHEPPLNIIHARIDAASPAQHERYLGASAERA